MIMLAEKWTKKYKVRKCVSNIKPLSLSPVLLSSYMKKEGKRKVIPGWLACARTCTKESGKSGLQTRLKTKLNCSIAKDKI